MEVAARPQETTLQQQQPRFGALYQHIAAELSDEEMASVWRTVEIHHRRCTSVQLLALLSQEHPLCLVSDLAEALVECTARLQVLTTTTAPSAKHMALPLVTVGAPAATKSSMSPEAKSGTTTGLNARWTPEETSRLLEYLRMTRGQRKSWPRCAELVGSKSCAQCKAKYNNMRAQDGALDALIDI
ncbi:hypothetical protein H4R18_002469 [Coemansia javaensis]|uniref:Myb-like domain-containing protein n=1 Tax=Coemansia javaensis TaxID=2761396 RepID=A0A9W8LIP2_9FUNG|nr:hypothetical protein H4R18_002469 [Coemansia javaensis]